MASVTVSPKFQIVIPKGVRESWHLKAGQTLEVYEQEGHLELVKAPHPRDLVGKFPGLSKGFRREKKDRLS